MHSIRTKITLLTVIVVIATLVHDSFDGMPFEDPEERFVRAKIAADRVIDDKQKKCGYYDLKWKQ